VTLITTPSIESARAIFSAAAREIRQGADAPRTLREALRQLASIRDRLRGRERRQVEIYIGLLQDEWNDRPTAVLAAVAPPHLSEAQHVVLHALQQEGPPARRLTLVREALDRLATLARQAGDRRERAAIARLAEPVILLMGKLERGAGTHQRAPCEPETRPGM
jgi:hypothetical protein